MKITVYTTTDCQFSKKEKEFLQAHKIPFEEKNIDTNKELLAEMMTLSNQFAGTPVTKFEKDNGETEIIKGFTEEEFVKVLNLTPVQADKPTPPSPTPPTPTPPSPTPTPEPTPVPPIPEVPPSPPVETPPPTPQTPTPPAETPTAPTNQPNPQDEQLNSILNDLQSKLDGGTLPETPKPTEPPSPPESAAKPTASPTPVVSSPTSALPTIPDPGFK